METADKYRKHADECEEMARQRPRFAASFQTLAQSWRELATAVEQKGKYGKAVKDETDGSMHT